MDKTARPRLVLFARFPQAGACKTRLIPALGADGAARVHRMLTERTVETLRAAGPVEVRFTGANEANFADWLGDDVALVEQVAGDLTDRLTAALDPAPVMFFGADTPDLSVDLVQQAIAALATHDGVIGPAEDGGYYLIGINAPHVGLFEGIDWSTERVFAQSMAKAETLGLSMAVLDALSDCDRPEDLPRWPWLAE